MPYLPRKDNSELVYETIEDETVLVDLSRGMYFSVAGVGSEIWVDLYAGRTQEEMIVRLCREYDAGPDEITAAVRKFLDSLVAEGLALYKPSPEDDEPIRLVSAEVTQGSPAKRPWQAPQLQKYADMQELLLLDAIHDSDDLGFSPPTDPPSR